jgi:hypothetical protein
MIPENQLAPHLSLDGEWQFALGDQTGLVHVPGAWEAQGYPDHEGPAFYRRALTLPRDWEGAHIWLHFGAASTHCTVRVNGHTVGTHEGLWTPFALDITPFVRFDGDNALECEVIKPADDGDHFPYREALVGFVPYVSSTFGGLWQSVRVSAYRGPALADVAVQADAAVHGVRVSGRVVLADRAGQGMTLAAVIDGVQTPLALHGDRFDGLLTLPAGTPRWSPEHPHRLTVQIVLRDASGAVAASVKRQVGLRQLATDGERLLFNDVPIFLRGILSWGWNPTARAPVFDDDAIREQFRRLRELGFNLFKLCLYVPPPRLFEIADEEGMLLWLELPLWWQRMTPHLHAQIEREYADIIARVAHHPSLAIVSLGCELDADMADPALIASLDESVRRQVTGCLVCDNSGSGEAYGGAFGDLADFHDYHFYCDLHDFTPLCDHFRRDWRPGRPWIFGEFCDHDDFRDPARLLEHGQRPAWRDLLGKDGGIHRWAYRDQEARMQALREAGDFPFSDADLVRISREQSLLVRKTIVEKSRARRDIGGYVLTGLRDTPISTSGLFDDHDDFKFDQKAFAAFHGPSVLLLERGRARIWRHGGDRPAPLDRFNHQAGSMASFRVVLASERPLTGAATLRWALSDDAGEWDGGETAVTLDDAAAGPRQIAEFTLKFPDASAPHIGSLRVWLEHDVGSLTNAWPMFVYPPMTRPLWTGEAAAIDKVLLTPRWTSDLARQVADGAHVICLPASSDELPTQALPFWRESVTLIQPHPIWSTFPQRGLTEMQFYSLASDRTLDRAALADLLSDQSGADVTLQPVFSRLDARLFRLTDYVLEAQIGAGRALFSTLSHGAGRGDQSVSPASNLAGQALLRAWLGTLR